MTNESVKVGDFFVCSWGYDQTNIDFYKVVGLTPSGKSVKLQRWQSKRVGGTGYSDAMVPSDKPFSPKLLTKRLRDSYDGGVAVTINSYSNAYPWEGQPCYATATGYGH